MDFSESTKVVYNRIQKLAPESVAKIVGYLLLQDHGDRDMIRLAFSPDNVIQSLINKAKTELVSLSKQSVVSPFQLNPYFPMTLRPAKPYRTEEYALQNQMQLLALDDQAESANSDFSSSYFSRRSQFPVKACHYFNKGICKHGDNCRYLHDQSTPLLESFSRIYSQSSIDGDDHLFSPDSLEKLELELAELLKSRRGFLISIASLPMLYYEKYGRILRADGYLTESQRHGKAGYSLTKLLARLKNSIRLIDRPHGQHSVILAEDVPKYLECIGGMVSGSRQIYLTFPAESTFTEQDVSNYFNNFGDVQDVRIPCQQKRMFGFVSFVYAETVKQILAKGNPHLVCGARVLVKPYREKSRLVDRKYTDKIQHHGFYSSYGMDADSEIHSIVPRVFNNSGFISRAEQAELHPSAERFNYLLDVLNNNNDSSGEDNDQDSEGLNLPESPFAPPMAGGISTVM